MIVDFKDLKVWQESHKLALEIYKSSASFPPAELYSLTSQLRRASISVVSNIAEGFGRSSKADQEHFYIMASGSLYELKSQLLIAKDLGYIDEGRYLSALAQADTAHRLLNALLRTHRSNNGL
jgi:four helix bundle protein